MGETASPALHKLAGASTHSNTSMPMAADRPQPGSFEPPLVKGPTTAEACSPKARTRSSRWLLQVAVVVVVVKHVNLLPKVV